MATALHPGTSVAPVRVGRGPGPSETPSFADVPERAKYDISHRAVQLAQGKFRGICGHYHLKAGKIDPGVSLWQPMRDAGFGVG
jgi:hypothetical protein